MLHNSEVREEVDQTKPRNQDATLLLHDRIKRDVGRDGGAAPPDVALSHDSIVKSMYSKTRLPGRDVRLGFVLFAVSTPREFLETMVAFPFEVPGWFFRGVAEFLKLGGVWIVSSLQ